MSEETEDVFDLHILTGGHLEELLWRAYRGEEPAYLMFELLSETEQVDSGE